MARTCGIEFLAGVNFDVRLNGRYRFGFGFGFGLGIGLGIGIGCLDFAPTPSWLG